MARTKTTSFALAGLLAVASLAAQATHFDSTTLCIGGSGTVGTTFNAVEAAINAARFTNLRDQTNLLSKLQAAYSKTLSSKWSDASAKLEDISSTATALAGAARPKLDSADTINSTVLTAQACIARPE